MQQENDNAPNNQDDKDENKNSSLQNDVAAAHEQAEEDIETDDDLSTEEDPTDDLDEGEMARLDNNIDDVDV